MSGGKSMWAEYDGESGMILLCEKAFDGRGENPITVASSIEVSDGWRFVILLMRRLRRLVIGRRWNRYER